MQLGCGRWAALKARDGTLKTVVLVYKAPGTWRHFPPGIGDFVRGACHLHEIVQGTGVQLRLDISQTSFAPLVANDPLCFCASSPEVVSAAPEYFGANCYDEVRNALRAFAGSPDDELHLSTNLGAWNRKLLPDDTKRFAQRFFNFTPAVIAASGIADDGPYEVLHIRSSDEFAAKSRPTGDIGQLLYRIVEREILPRQSNPIIVLSDSKRLKADLVWRYGFRTTATTPAHSGFGDALPTAIDLAVLMRSSHTYSINLWKPWWSGFSHYTSLVFSVPSTNFKSPDFVACDIGTRHE